MKRDSFIKHSVIIVILFCAVAGVFGPALFYGFHNLDDAPHLLANPFLRDLSFSGIERIFTNQVNNIYIPLTGFSFALERHFFGLDPFVYHFNNLLLHMMAVIGVFIFARQLSLPLWGAALSALVFGVHPLRVESVVWVTERKDVLFMVFYMLALIGYVHYLKLVAGGRNPGAGRRLFWVLGVALLGFLSVLAKPMALSLPLVLLLLDWFFCRRSCLELWLEKILTACAVWPVAWISFAMNARPLNMVFPDSFLIWVWCFWFYIRKFFFPGALQAIYALPKPVSLLNPHYSIPIAASLLLAGSLWIFRRKRLYVFAVLFYVLTIFFLLRMDTARDLNIVADRFMYLPGLGLTIYLGGVIARRFQEKKRASYRAVLAAAVLAGLILMGLRTREQVLLWKTNLRYWQYQAANIDHNEKRIRLVYAKLAEAYLEDAGFGEARFFMRQARGGEAAGWMERRQSDAVEKAVFYYQQALQISPDAWDPHFNLGRIYAVSGELEKARAHLRQVFVEKPNFYWAYYWLGLVELSTGRDQRALWYFHTALCRAPEQHKALSDKVLDSVTAVIRRGDAPLMYCRAYEDLREFYREEYGQTLDASLCVQDNNSAD
ncbi:MAG: tetratricopeptide repeat protein [Candidatus Omnitrophota bacterium]